MLVRGLARSGLVTALVVATCLLGARPASGLTINGDGHAVLRLPVAPMADVSITKTVSPDPVMEDSDLTYSIRIGNSGPDPAAAVTLTDVIPSGTTFVSITQTSGPTFTLSAPNVGG